ncbi:type III pantothenate kinase [Verrucomicrobiales bacterium]|nr:type III pantothenate kinase [Verrucomicrobiales bacterium]MDA7525667.1 type III pantothenate kinase [Verrucomicrobiales bacterium]
MKRILIDVGNTRTKLVFADDVRLIERRQLSTDEISRESILEVIGDWASRADQVVVCSVVPSRTTALQEVFGEDLLIVSFRVPLGIGIDYPEPETIGADRLANAAALAKLHGQPGIVVDFGTAVTFDVLSVEGNYCGGVIAPGVEMMSDYMSERTALLPRVELIKDPPPFGRSTEEAMQAGAYYGYAGMVRRILDELLATFDQPDEATIVATGGAGELFYDALGVKLYEPDLTLHGLRFIAELQ